MPDTLEVLRATIGAQYTVERELGQGGMATVFLAHDRKHDRQVAVKVLNPDISSSVGPDRFLREIKLAAGLQHPHILTVYDSGDAAGLLYYVMPFVPGESLRDRLNRETQLSIEDAVQLAREVADALGYAHSQGVVHRDIKPENILLSGGHAIVADFGIARAVSGAGPDRLTQTGTAIGTPTYMSPEQSVDDPALDGRSDIYSLGCVLYEMLAGRPPFTGPSARAIMAQHSMEVPPSLQVMRQSIPDELEDAVFRALEKVPADRFATAAQFAKALTGNATTTSSPRLSRARTARISRGHVAPRKRRLVGFILVLVVPLLAAGGWFLSRGKSGGLAADDGRALRSIAVLYFQDRTPGRPLQHLADGFTDALIKDLGSISALSVISRNGVLPWRDANVTPDSIGRALQVGTLVDGTLEEAGGQLRVSVELIDAGSGKLIDSKTLQRPRGELFALQDDLAQEVSVFLRQRLGQEIQLRERKSETGRPEAWEAYQRAQELVDETGPLLAAGDAAGALERFRQADSAFAGVEAMDRGWVSPVVQRGWVAYRQARAGSRDAMQGLVERSIAEADRALEREPGDAEALELSGHVRYFAWLFNLEPDARRREALLSRAEQDLRAAVAADPGRADAWSTLSHMQLSQQKNAEGKLAALKAYEADPYLSSANLVLWRIFAASFDLGDRIEARHWCDEGHRRFPDESRFQECRLMNYTFGATRQDIPEAWSVRQRMVELTPADRQEYARHYGGMLVAVALARAGMADSARRVILASRADAELDQTRDISLYEIIARCYLNDRDEALRQLGIWLAANPQRRTFLAGQEVWYFPGLREDPRYRTLIGS